MKVLAFGTYDARMHPRIAVLIDGLREHGHTITELNAPLGLSTAGRVRLLHQPWRLPVLAGRLLTRWAGLVARTAAYRGRRSPDAVLVGYLGHFDVLLARLLFPQTPILLDHLVFASGTALDRGVRPGPTVRALQHLDRLALGAADVVVVDTAEHAAVVLPRLRARTVIAPVGAERRWFEAGSVGQAGGGAEGVDGDAASGPDPLTVVFFGLFTPLQGSVVIAEALALLHARGVAVRATLVGSGQDADAVRRVLAGVPEITWLDWVDGHRLPSVVAAHRVCLGIFGTSDKALRVVPNKVYQGAAAGCAVVTSDTAAQRRALDGAALLVPPGDPVALADALERLAGDPSLVSAVRTACRARASHEFTARAVTGDLDRAMRAARRREAHGAASRRSA